MEIKEFADILRSRVLVLDGAMGTMIQRFGLTEADYRGSRFADYEGKLLGCNDLLCITSPETIISIHRAYIDAGADIITTNSFNANSISMADYGLDRIPGLLREINVSAARLACHAREASACGRRILVAGTLGPTGKSASMSPEVENPAYRNVDYDQLYAAYSDQAEGLIEGGSDVLLFETVFDTLNLKAGLDAANQAMTRLGRRMPIMISATLSEKGGRTLSGQTLKAFVASVAEYDNVVSIGLNCGFGAEAMRPYLRELGEVTKHFVTAHPNAGLPNVLGEYEETPETFAAHMRQVVGEGLVNVAGGCCGTTPEHIAALRNVVDEAQCKIHICQAIKPSLIVSGLEQLEILPENRFVNVGERCNVAGSRKFLRLIKEKNYEEAMLIARRQVDAGAMMLDINMDDALLDARAEMIHFLRYIASDPEIARVPVMVDSSNWEVVEAALKNLQGKSIVNSISLKEGEEKFIAKARRIRQLGAAVIVMAFDEAGQAADYERKIEISRRAYELLTGECGFKADDIIFDVNIMAVATGIEEHNRYALDYIRAVRWIKENLPGVRTSGGVSNLSFAFRGKNSLREAMHAVFLYHAIAGGLDMGIVNPSTSIAYEDIEPGLREVIEDVVLCRRAGAADRLAEFAAGEEAGGSGNGVVKKTSGRDMSVPAEERLRRAVLKGDSEFLHADIDEVALSMPAVRIVEGPLMEAMMKVGELFGEGKMFLPQVVKTARTMKMAVDYLQPRMESELAANVDGKAGVKAGKVLFATVKGDVHDIGKNIVGIVLGCNNYEVIDLGVMVPAEEIIDAARRESPDLICLSGLITPSLAEMVNVARALEESGMDIPLIVGGATTSKLHTALRIAPEYHAPVVHAADAAQNPLLAAKLLNVAEREKYVAGLRDEQARLRDEFEGKTTSGVSLAEARAAHLERNEVKSHRPAEPMLKPGRVIKIDLNLKDLKKYINWKMFFSAWNISGDLARNFPMDLCEGCIAKWKASLSAELSGQAGEALRLYADAREVLAAHTEDFDGAACVVFHHAYSEGDDLIIGNVRLPMLRQQSRDSDMASVVDFIRNKEEGGDYVGVFCVTSGRMLMQEAESMLANGDGYGALLRQSLADRLAEAASEFVHAEVRRKLWGYAPDEDLTPAEAIRGRYQGIRPAMGYPMLPDQLLNLDLMSLLPIREIGVSLTENGAMTPSATVSGIYIANPGARYLYIGEIGDDQIADYASRRGLSEQRLREILKL